jgi:hypothetical protein
VSKAFILTQDDLDSLLTMIDRDPDHGERGGSSNHLSTQERDAYREAHRFYNYQVRTWVSKVST